MSTNDNPYAEDDPFLEEQEQRGVYIGPVDRDEALEAIRAHHAGPLPIDYPERGFIGGDIRRAKGWMSEVGLESDDSDHTDEFAFYPDEGEVPLGTGMLYRDALVLDLVSSPGRSWEAER
jgi:hypothetical protein